MCGCRLNRPRTLSLCKSSGQSDPSGRLLLPCRRLYMKPCEPMPKQQMLHSNATVVCVTWSMFAARFREPETLFSPREPLAFFLCDFCSNALHQLHSLCRAAPRGRPEYTAAHFVVVDEKLLDLVHERWRQVIEIAHFRVEPRTNPASKRSITSLTTSFGSGGESICPSSKRRDVP